MVAIEGLPSESNTVIEVERLKVFGSLRSNRYTAAPLVNLSCFGMISASAGRFTPRSIFEEARGRPAVLGSCSDFAELIPVATTDPSSLTGKTWTNCPEESTTYRSLLTRNDPLRVNTDWLEVRFGFNTKKPWPWIAISSEFWENATLPWENSWATPFSSTP